MPKTETPEVEFIKDIAEADCEYIDLYGEQGCPVVITKRHYRCPVCDAREFLKKEDIHYD